MDEVALSSIVRQIFLTLHLLTVNGIWGCLQGVNETSQFSRFLEHISESFNIFS